MSDHAIISGQYSSKDIVIPEQFRIVRNNKSLTSKSLQNMVTNSQSLNSVFS